MLVVFIMKSIAILGVSEVTRSEYPILVAASTINIANFVKTIGYIFNSSIGMWRLHKIIYLCFLCCLRSSDIFNVKKSSQLIYPICLIILISSLLMASNHLEHRNEGFGKIPYYLHLPIHFIFPVSLLLISWIQMKIREKNGNSTT